MGRVADKVGMRFGRLVVVSEVPTARPKRWNCICECGAETQVSGSNLTNGNTSSCGCVWRERHRGSMIGRVFGRLSVVGNAESQRYGRACFAAYVCRCECGTEKTILGTSLRAGLVKTCGFGHGLTSRQISDQKRAHHLRRKEAISRAAPNDVLAFQALRKAAAHLSSQTGVQHHVDHVVPLVSDLVCGLHVAANFEIIPAAQNIRKRNRFWPDMAEA
jgi:hypothetical protein